MARAKKPDRWRRGPSAEPVPVLGEIETIGPRGDGVLVWRSETGDQTGRAHAPCTAPGDRGRFMLEGDRAGLDRLDHRGPDRREPPCPLFGACGGCALQHLSDTAYTDWKLARVKAALARRGLDDTMIAPLVRLPVASRRRAVFGLSRKTIGFNQRASHRLIPVSDCLVLDPGLNERLGRLSQLGAIFSVDSANLAVTLCTNGLDVDLRLGRGASLAPQIVAALGDWMRAAGCVRFALDGEAVLQTDEPVIDVGGVAVSLPVGAFLQASVAAEAALRATAHHALQAAIKAESARVFHIADLFCGVGTFALPLALRHRVTAIDENAAACAALRAAAGAAQAAGRLAAPVQVEVRNLFERPLTVKELGAFDAVVMDPPRAGALDQARTLAKSGIPLIISVSCNPDTFARDAEILSQGGYALTAVTPVDQFIYSPHVELVGVFHRASRPSKPGRTSP